MNRLNVEICFNNNRRIFSINHSLKIADVAKRCLDIYDLSVNEITGIYFYFVDANVYFCSNEDVELDTSVRQFLDTYGPEFPVLTISNMNNQYTEKFREDLNNYFQQQNTQTYMYRPTINVTYSQPTPNTLEFDYNPQTRRFQQSRNNQQNNQQNNANPFSNIMRNLGTNILNNLNNIQQNSPSNNQNNRNMYADFFYTMPANNNTNNALYSLFEQVLTNDGERLVCRQTDINNLRRGTYGDLKNNNYILEECTQCTITLEDFTNNTQVIVLPCRHAFKEQGIINWLTNCSNKCPTCRREVSQGIPRGFI